MYKWLFCLVLCVGSSLFAVSQHPLYQPPSYQPKEKHGKEAENKRISPQYHPRSWPQQPRQWFPNQGRVVNVQGQGVSPGSAGPWGGPGGGGIRRIPPNGSVWGTVNDRQLYLEISHFLAGRNLGISVSQGNVVLTGVVNSQEERASIQHEISEMYGVRNIDNQLTIANTKTWKQPRWSSRRRGYVHYQ